MFLASLSFSGTDWLWPLVAVFVIATVLVIRGLWRSPATPGVRFTCGLLKLLGLAALAACVLEPVWSHSHAKPGANFFAILADNSQGLQIKDRDATKSRGEEMKVLLGRHSWQETLADTFTVRGYSFDSHVQPTENFAELDLSGPATALGGAMRNLAERYRGQPLAGILLFTDGNATDIPGDLDTRGLPPIFPVVIGRDEVPPDISLQRVAATQTAFEDAPVTIQADVAAPGYRGSEIVAQLLDGSGKKIQEQALRVASDEKLLSFRFLTKPTQHGVSFYTVRAAARDELVATATNASLSKEATLANNSRAVVVNRGRGPHRILYVSGRPNWEFKFLNRALASDEELQLVALIRIAKREPKFDFIGRRGESVNPLFRGFDRQDEEVERYDQPVLVRLNTRDEFELKGGFPKTPEDLYGYDSMIVDAVEAEFFTRDQMMLVQKFVSERGGALLMLGGADSFHEGNYARTPIGDILPVYLDRAIPPPAPASTARNPQAKEFRPGMKLVLTREGWLQPWLRLRDNETDERSRLNSMPGFDLLNMARDVKPGASVLATVSDAQSAIHPALVAQRFGNGRTAALLIGDFWRWGFRDEGQHKDMDKAWRQMMRWLVTDVPGQIEAQAAEQPGGDIVVQVQARDKKFQAVDNASVAVTISAVSATGRITNSVRLTCEPSANAPGAYTATYIPRQPGGYRAEATVLDANGAEVGKAEAGWTSDPAADEFRSLKPNRALLEQLAKQTGGEVVAADALEKFAKSLPNRKAPVTETVASPLWHTPAMFLFAIVCFAGEWGVRRWKGLP